jgi:hypothetical protein
MTNLNNNPGLNPEDRPFLTLIVDGKEYKWFEQYITNRQIRELTGAPQDSLESLLFLAIARPWEDELVNDSNPIDLARPEVEHFYFKNILLLTINGKEYTWDKQYITGAEIKQLGNIDLRDDLFLSIRKPWDDELVPNDKQINLARPGIEHFISKEMTRYSFFIAKKEYYTYKNQISVREILTDFAKVDPASNTLAEKSATGFNEFKNLDELLDLTKVRHFVVFNNDSTQVS